MNNRADGADRDREGQSVERNYATFHRVLGEFYRDIEAETPAVVTPPRGTFTLYPQDGLQRLWGVTVMRWARGAAAVAPLALSDRLTLFLGAQQSQGRNSYNYPLTLLPDPAAFDVQATMKELREVRDRAAQAAGLENPSGQFLPLPLWLEGEVKLTTWLSNKKSKPTKGEVLALVESSLRTEREAARRFEEVNPFDEETRRLYAQVRALETAKEVLAAADTQAFVKLFPRPQMMVTFQGQRAYVPEVGLMLSGGGRLEVIKPKSAKSPLAVTEKVLTPLAVVGNERFYRSEDWAAAVAALKEKREG